MNFFENGLANRGKIINRMAVEIFANTDSKRDDLKIDDYFIELGVVFRGPIFSLLCGYSISFLIFIVEFVYFLKTRIFFIVLC